MNSFFNQYTRSYNNRFKISAIKLVSDGSLGARTALLQEPYHDDPSTIGFQVYKTQDELDELVLTSHQNDLPVIIHAIGNGALEMCFHSFEKARNEFPNNHPRHGIVHCQITTKEQIQ
jgi:predicted amidohydrolase YtcJ